MFCFKKQKAAALNLAHFTNKNVLSANKVIQHNTVHFDIQICLQIKSHLRKKPKFISDCKYLRLLGASAEEECGESEGGLKWMEIDSGVHRGRVSDV